MRIEIEIPKEFVIDYKGDMFKDFFSRVLCDIENGTLCGNYEKETAEMFLKAFDESRIAFDMEKVVEQLEKLEDTFVKAGSYNVATGLNKAIDIVKKGGVE